MLTISQVAESSWNKCLSVWTSVILSDTLLNPWKRLHRFSDVNMKVSRKNILLFTNHKLRIYSNLKLLSYSMITVTKIKNYNYLAGYILNTTFSLLLELLPIKLFWFIQSQGEVRFLQTLIYKFYLSMQLGDVSGVSSREFLALQHLLLTSGSKLSELGLCTRYCFNSFLSQAPQFKGFPKRKNSLRKRKKKMNKSFCLFICLE